MDIDANASGKGPRGPWWLPLLITAVVLIVITIGNATQGRHVANPASPAGAIATSLAIGTIIGLPAFFAGKRYARRSTMTRPRSA